MASDGGRLAEVLAAREAASRRELEEIDLLMRQARIEADRHAARREAADERFKALMDQHSVPAELREAHAALILQYQRSALMSSQMEVLEGKQKVLQRLESSLSEVLHALESAGVADLASPATREASPPLTSDGGALPGRSQSNAVLNAQEEMRRAIARQMHDGPAQSIANIALQAEVVQRLLAGDPVAAQRELAALRGMVQHALEATKSFIFEVRPMVLDDLGLVPTLRRAAAERQRRSGVPVRFESVGPDRRLNREVETQLFRLIDDALEAYLAKVPAEVALRLNWTDARMEATVRSLPVPFDASPAPPEKTSSGLPEALQSMITEQDAARAASGEAWTARYALGRQAVDALHERASAAGVTLRDKDNRLSLELSLEVNLAIDTSVHED
ncbi:MAG TPA: histidine kinase [Candidatus Limnocylindrales bacterium]|nr:histidine kinase [Candidatus Limnocylindrales bacterium]